MAKQETLAKDLGEALESGLRRSLERTFRSIIEGTFSAKEAFRDFANAILQEIARILAKRIAAAVVSTALTAIGGQARGGINTGGFRPVQGFTGGGIVSRPTVGIIGEGGSDEAVVPLPGNRKIPVDLRGGGMGGDVNIILDGVIDTADFVSRFRSPAARAEIRGVIQEAMGTRSGFQFRRR